MGCVSVVLRGGIPSTVPTTPRGSSLISLDKFENLLCSTSSTKVRVYVVAFEFVAGAGGYPHTVSEDSNFWEGGSVDGKGGNKSRKRAI